jgi:hypothetical protein
MSDRRQGRATRFFRLADPSVILKGPEWASCPVKRPLFASLNGFSWIVASAIMASSSQAEGREPRERCSAAPELPG